MAQAKLFEVMGILINPTRVRKSGLESLETSRGYPWKFQQEARSITERVQNLDKCYFWIAAPSFEVPQKVLLIF